MLHDAEILVVGCGNILFKDDGFGPTVINALEDYFKNREKPDNVTFIDAGTGAPNFVFSLPHDSWKKMIVVDVVEFDAKPGTLKRFKIKEIPKTKEGHGNVHSWPVNQLLYELSKKIDVVIIGCKPKEISTPNVEMGLTKPVKEAVSRAVEMILEEIKAYA